MVATMQEVSKARLTVIALTVLMVTFMGYTDHISSDVVSGIYATVIAYSFGYINGKKVTGQSQT